MSLLDCGIATSEQLVQTLKRESDAGRQLATLQIALDDHAVFVPKKAFLLADCALEALRKENARTNPGYWTLLSAVLAQDDIVASIVTRHSVLALATPIFAGSAGLWEAAAPVLAVLLPPAIRRAPIEGANEVVLAFLEAVPRICTSSTASVTQTFLDAVTRAWVPAISLGANGKKTAKAFEGAVATYAHARMHAESVDAPLLLDQLDMVLARAVFSQGMSVADGIGALADRIVANADDDTVVHAAPAVLAICIRVSWPDWEALEQRATGTPSAQVRQMLLDRFLAPVVAAIGSSSAPYARMRIAQIIEAHGLYVPGGEDNDKWRALLTKLRTDTLACVQTFRDASFKSLIALWHIYPDGFQGQLVDALAAAACEYSEHGAHFVRRVIDRFSHARSMPTLLAFLRGVCEQVAQKHGASAPSILARGSLFYQGTLVLEEALYVYTPVPQAASLLEAAVDGAEKHLDNAGAFACTSFLLLLAIRNVGLVDADVSNAISRTEALASAALDRGMLAPGLRLIYGLRHPRHGVDFESVPRTLATPPSNLASVIKKGTPEVVVESLRAALDHGIDISEAVNAALSHFSASSTLWDGNTLGIDKACLPAAVWRLLTTRWTHILDDYPDLLPRLVTILQDTLALDGPVGELSRQLLRNPAFHEMANWRTAVLESVGDALKWIDPSSLPERRRDIGTALAGAAMLSYVPAQYIDASLIHKLSWLDGYLAAFGGDVDQWSKLQDVLRRSLGHHATLRVDAYIAGAQTNASFKEPANSSSLVRTTLALVERTEWTLDCDGRRRAMEAAESLAHGSVGECILYTIVAVAAERATDNIMSSSVLERFQSSDWASMPAISLIVRAYAAELQRGAQGDIVLLASIFERVCSEAAPDAKLVTALFCCIDALQRADPARANVLCAAYTVAEIALPSEVVQTHIAPVFVAAVGRMSEQVYAATLDSLSSALTTSVDAHALLNTLGLVLQHGPGGTSRTARKFFYSLLVFLPSAITRDASLILPAAVAIERVCAFRALLLRAPDVPRILGVFGVILRPDGAKVNVSTSAVFGSIVASLSALVRLRKDLVSAYLPHLSQVLCSLVPLLASVSRRNAGDAVLRELLESTPCWSDPVARPLEASDAQSLGRLLSELPVKSTPLVAAAVAQKRRRLDGSAQTLAGAMSKHAIYMLLAYVRCVTSISTTISQPLRHELHPGLMALCSMISSHERDAALKSLLDAPGQLVFKSIWADWERQRYRGA
ncbi:hypothetical protein MCUN1_001237 [Malassezia cuniculi]|uniref:Nucleolar 27S pre-rRNA processing Urb2/Npa2 C-terminal domain-containing protein n=1 Tax=Malassezia cuniculi TaxID=948313 RepID=A0AAF0EPE2_9BASI|nr:hypothetical protein MCUN1_001237 [Malassezia cuniculi]